MDRKEFRAMQVEETQRKRLADYRRLNAFARKGQIVFTGSSLMDFFPVNELQQSLGVDACIYNRGVLGFVTTQLLEHIDVMILDLAPSKLFINIGTNDIGRGLADRLMANYEAILRRVKEALPDCAVYIMAYYPCNDLDDFGLSPEEHEIRFRTRNPESLLRANAELEKLAARMGCRYVDANAGLCDGRGRLRKEISLDGVHLRPDGYVPVLRNLKPYLEE